MAMQPIRLSLIRMAALSLALFSPIAAAQAQTKATDATEVRIPSEPGVVLAGTLETPGVGAGPFPVAIIIAGTGPWTRGGFIAIRGRLLAGGMATLDFDKRGQGRSTGAFVDTIPAMERDVAAIVAFLRTQPRVDPDRIVLIGQSQGAVAAPAVASRDPRIAAVVMLSGPVGPRGEYFLGILRGHLTRAGKDPATIARVTGAVGRWMEARSRRDGPDALRRTRDLATTAFISAGFTPAQATDFTRTLDDPVVLSMFEAAPDRAMAALRRPVLAIYGTRDDVIAPGPSAAAAAAALGGNADALVVTVPGMTHELQRADTKPGEMPAGGDATMPVVVDTIAAWLIPRLRNPH